MKYNHDGRIPIKMWLDDIEMGALNQAKNLAQLPFAFRQIALMPDAHQGYGMPIGGVMATKGVVVPNAVGVDIGCGMCSVETDIRGYTPDELKKALGLIRREVPVGFKKHSVPQHGMPDVSYRPGSVVDQQMKNAEISLGTLGGGNHFIELQADSTGALYVMIHSGSRNLGLRVAEAYNLHAKAMNEKWYSCVPPGQELAFLPLDSDLGREYLQEMDYCVAFAEANRYLMMQRVLECLGSVFGNFEADPPINIAHNYAQMENHFGANVMIHRKGATSARAGELGIIPGSQGAASFIVRGLGNRESFNSCSHGAGRKMGRKAATRELSLEGEQQKLNSQGIIHTVRHASDLDEAPGAYKNIEEVMLQQADLVEIVTRLQPLAVVKG